MKFVDKQLAIKLKENGFDRPCLGWYDIENNDDKLILNVHEGTLSYKNLLEYTNDIKTIADAPTIEQVLEWLREEKNIIVTVGIFTNVSMSRFVIKIIKIVDKDSLTEHFLKGCIEKFYVNYDDAILAGIEYVVEHLI